MVKMSLKVKATCTPKPGTHGYTWYNRYGCPRSVYHKFNPCRVCLREFALRGESPGVTKSSW